MNRLLRGGAIAGPVLFTLAWIVLGFISPGYTMWDIVVPSYSPIAQPISGLGLGVTGPYMNAAFIVSGILLLAGVIGIVSSIPELSRRERWLYASLFALAPIGMVMDGIFTLESFFLHFLGYLVAIGSTVISFFVVGSVVRRVAGWRRVGSALRVGSAVTLVLLVIAQFTFDPIAAGANVGIAGLTERILIVEVLAWFATMGWFALRSPRAASDIALKSAA